MTKILTLNEIKDFINKNRSKLDKDSTVILTHGNSFSFLRDASFLNLEGVYDWTLENGELIDGKHGDVMSFWGVSNGTFITGESSKNKASEHDDFFYNFMFDGRDSVPKNLQGFEKELQKYQGDNSPDKKVLISAIINGHYVGTGIKIYDPNITLNYTDSYGHKTSMSPAKPILAIECEMKMEQKFNPNKTTKNYFSSNESIITKFDKFLNECKNDEIYKDSLDDNYWKTISYKFPDYNDPNSEDHEKAVDYILYHMKKKYKDEDWNEIEKSIKDKISSGIS